MSEAGMTRAERKRPMWMRALIGVVFVGACYLALVLTASGLIGVVSDADVSAGVVLRLVAGLALTAGIVTLVVRQRRIR